MKFGEMYKLTELNLNENIKGIAFFKPLYVIFEEKPKLKFSLIINLEFPKQKNGGLPEEMTLSKIHLAGETLEFCWGFESIKGRSLKKEYWSSKTNIERCFLEEKGKIEKAFDELKKLIEIFAKAKRTAELSILELEQENEND